MALELDLTDPLVRAMADSNHEPSEVWTNAGDLLSVHCRACGNSWPCPTRVELRRLDGLDDPFTTAPSRST